MSSSTMLRPPEATTHDDNKRPGFVDRAMARLARWLSRHSVRMGLLVLAGAMVGILSPLILFFNDLFPGAPTLEAQYVLKDIVLVAGALVVTAPALGADDRVPG